MAVCECCKKKWADGDDMLACCMPEGGGAVAWGIQQYGTLLFGAGVWPTRAIAVKVAHDQYRDQEGIRLMPLFRRKRYENDPGFGKEHRVGSTWGADKSLAITANQSSCESQCPECGFDLFCSGNGFCRACNHVCLICTRDDK